MSNESYDAVLADIDARIAKLHATREGILELMTLAGNSPSGGPGGSPATVKPAHDAFIGMSIPEASKKHLGAARKKLSTQELMSALTEGGLPESKYSTVYAILRRREKQVGDIINMKGDWALAEWYPNYRSKAKAKAEMDNAIENAASEVADEDKEEIEQITKKMTG